nr:TIR domain-containing protein [uncultured Draconibacterium sp.]
MAIYTSTYFKNLASERSQIFENRQFSAQRGTKDHFDIFLSHSFLDKQEIRGLYLELTNLGYSVYVDWIVDPELDRNNVTKESAELIRRRMKSSKTLLLAVSENAEMSKWMPWELGYVDGNTNRCAIIPVSRQTYAPKVFRGKEYLKLYPFIKKAALKYQIKEKIWVVEGHYAYSDFENWYKTGSIEKYKSENIFEL